LLSYTYSWWFYPDITIIHIEIIDDWVIAFGSTIFIVSSLGSSFLEKILKTRPIQLLGKTSYSLYLFHGIILINMIHLFYGILPLWLILVMVFLTSLLIALVSYYIVEIPSINLGKRLVNRNDNKFQLLNITKKVNQKKI
jgi:peptidoglycan/LPS O-acetylase OafA/YrhL